MKYDRMIMKFQILIEIDKKYSKVWNLCAFSANFNKRCSHHKIQMFTAFLVQP